jgi:hypothetical protein
MQLDMVNTPDYAISTAVLLGVQSQLLPVQKKEAVEDRSL